MGRNLQHSQILYLWTAGLLPPVPALHPQGRGKSLERQAFLQQMVAVYTNQSMHADFLSLGLIMGVNR